MNQRFARTYLELYEKLKARQGEEGQTLAEYGLILALIALVVIAALIVLGDSVAALFERINCVISGGFKC